MAESPPPPPPPRASQVASATGAAGPGAPPGPAYNYKAILQAMVQQNATDLHLKVAPPRGPGPPPGPRLQLQGHPAGDGPAERVGPAPQGRAPPHAARGRRPAAAL